MISTERVRKEERDRLSAARTSLDRDLDSAGDYRSDDRLHERYCCLEEGNDVESEQLLESWLVDALKSLGGRGTIVEVCRAVWANHEPDLRVAGDLFYTWQYEIRWAATNLRNAGTLRSADRSPKGVWELTSRADPI